MKKAIANTNEINAGIKGMVSASLATDMKFSAGDIVMMVSTKIEDSIRAHMKTVRATVKALDKELATVEKEITQQRTAVAEEAMRVKRAGLEAFILSWVDDADKREEALSCIVVHPGSRTVGAAGKEKRTAELRMTGDCGMRLSTSTDVQDTEEIILLCARHKQLLKDKMEALTKDGELNHKLAELPAYERKTLAALTRSALQNSDIGRQVSQQVDSIIDGLNLGLTELMAASAEVEDVD